MNGEHRTDPARGGDGAEADAFLRAALRHAPDRELRPSAALSAQILEAARRATATPPAGAAARGGWRAGLQRWRAATAGWLRAPGAGAACASLALATVIGLMWRDGPPPEAEPRFERKSAAPLAEPASTTPAAAPAQQREAGAARDAAADSGAAPAASPPATAVAPARPPRLAPAPAAPPRAAAASTPQATTSGRRTIEAAPALRDERVAQAGPPRSAAEEPEAAPQSPRSDSAVPERSRSAPAPSPSVAPSAAPAVEPLTTATAKSARPQAALLGRAEPDAAADPLAPAIAAHQAAPDEARGLAARSADAAAAPTATSTPALSWLLEVQQLTRGRWRLAPPPADAAWRSVRPGAAGRLAIVEATLWWQPMGDAGPSWHAPLPAATLARLRAALADWAPAARP